MYLPLVNPTASLGLGLFFHFVFFFNLGLKIWLFLFFIQSHVLQLLIFPQKRIEKTNGQQNGVLNILSSARSSLTQAKSVLGLLQESKEVKFTTLRED